MVEYLGLADFLLIAEAVLGVPAEVLYYSTDLNLADSALHAPAWDPPGEVGAADVRGSHVEEAVATLLVRDTEDSVLAVGCLYDETDGLMLSGGATRNDPRAGPATGALLEASAAPARRLGRDLLVEADDVACEVVRTGVRRRRLHLRLAG